MLCGSSIRLLGVVALLSGKFLIGSGSHEPVLAVLWMIVSGGMIYMLFVILNTFIPSPRGAAMLLNLLVMTLAMLGGCFFPLDLMPDSLARIGRWTPNGWALLLFRNILAGHFDRIGLATAFAAVLAFTALLFTAAAWRLRWRFLV